MKWNSLVGTQSLLATILLILQSVFVHSTEGCLFQPFKPLEILMMLHFVLLFEIFCPFFEQKY